MNGLAAFLDKSMNDPRHVHSQRSEAFVLPVTVAMLPTGDDGSLLSRPKMRDLAADILALCQRAAGDSFSAEARGPYDNRSGLRASSTPATQKRGFFAGLEQALGDALQHGSVGSGGTSSRPTGRASPLQDPESGRVVRFVTSVPTREHGRIRFEPRYSHANTTKESPPNLDVDFTGICRTGDAPIKYISHECHETIHVDHEGTLSLPFDDTLSWSWYHGVRINLHRLGEDGRLYCDSGPPIDLPSDRSSYLLGSPGSLSGSSSPGAQDVGGSQTAGQVQIEADSTGSGDPSSHPNGGGFSISGRKRTDVSNLRAVPAAQNDSGDSTPIPVASRARAHEGAAPDSQGGPRDHLHSASTGDSRRAGAASSDPELQPRPDGDGGSEDGDASTPGDASGSAVPSTTVSMVLLPLLPSPPVTSGPGKAWIEVDASKRDIIERWIKRKLFSGLPCALCKSQRHTEETCHLKETDETVLCYNCQKEGHLQKDCPSQRRTKQRHPCGFCKSLHHHRLICPWPMGQQEGASPSFYQSPMGKKCLKAVAKARERFKKTEDEHYRLLEGDEDEAGGETEHQPSSKPWGKPPPEPPQREVSVEIHQTPEVSRRQQGEVSSDAYQPPEVLRHQRKEVSSDEYQPPEVLMRQWREERRNQAEAHQTRSTAQKAAAVSAKRAPEKPEPKSSTDLPKKAKKAAVPAKDDQVVQLAAKDKAVQPATDDKSVRPDE